MKKLLVIFLLIASCASAQTLNVGEIKASTQSCFVASVTATNYTFTDTAGAQQASFTATPSYDNLSEFVEADSQFVAAKAYPRYFFSIAVWSAYAEDAVVYLYKNGVEIRAMRTNGAVSPCVLNEIVTNVAAGDIFQVKLDVTVTRTFDYALYGKYCRFQGYELP